MSALVRRAGIADVPALVGLRSEMFLAMGVTSDSPRWRDHAGRWLVERIHDSSICLVVVEERGEVVACAMGAIRDAAPSPTVPEGRDVLISNVCTRSDVRGRGHGSAAFSAVMAWARSTGIGRAELLATEDGAGLYRPHGFVVSAHPVMRCDLSVTPMPD